MMLLVSYAYLRRRGGIKHAIRSVRAIVERHTVQIDVPGQHWGQARLGDHFYADKAPGASLTAVPLPAAARVVLRPSRAMLIVRVPRVAVVRGDRHRGRSAGGPGRALRVLDQSPAWRNRRGVGLRGGRVRGRDALVGVRVPVVRPRACRGMPGRGAGGRPEPGPQAAGPAGRAARARHRPRGRMGRRH